MNQQSIITTRDQIIEHQKAIDELYQSLVTTLQINPTSRAEAYLFDLMYNTYKQDEFEEDLQTWMTRLEDPSFTEHRDEE